MEKNDIVISLLEKANFTSYSYDIISHRYVAESFRFGKTDIFRAKFAAHLISKDIILVWKDDSLIGSATYKYFITKYDIDDFFKIYKKFSIKLNSLLNEGFWTYSNEMKQIYNLLYHTDFLDYCYFSFPNGWLEEGEFIEWIEKRIELNIPHKLVDITNLTPNHNKEICGEYIIIANTREVKLLMKSDVRSSLSGSKTWIVDRSVVEIEPLFDFMIGWSEKRLLQFCTFHRYKLEQVRAIEFL